MRLPRPIDAATQARVSAEGRRCLNPPSLQSPSVMSASLFRQGAATSRASDRHRVLDGRHHLKRFAMEQVGEVDYLITWRDNELVPHTSVVVRVRIRRCFAFPKSPSCLRLFSRLPALMK